jgi:hypothetical protein
MRNRLLSVLAALLLLGPAAPALAQDGNPFDGLPPAQPTPAPTVEPVDDPSNDGVTRDTLYIIGGALLVSFFVIGWWISRDARRSLPAERREDLDRMRAGSPAPRPHRHEQQAKAKARAKARAQRQARKAGRKTRR